MHPAITAIGTYLPKNVRTNFDFEKILNTSDEWIEKRTGIKERRFVSAGEYTSDLCVRAAKELASNFSKTLEDVDFIILATTTADHIMPSVASQVQCKLGIKKAGTLDITAACAGFVYGIILAQGLVSSGHYKKVLVFGAETLSRFLDFSDRSTCILFGDGAGAAMVEASSASNILGGISGTEGEKGANLYLSNLATTINDQIVEADNKIHQNGRQVFKWAVETVSRESLELIKQCNLNTDDIDWFVPHSANFRIIESICRQIDIPVEKALESIGKCGNTSSASIPLALDQGLKEGKVKTGDKILMIGFGGGLTYAGIVFEWGVN